MINYTTIILKICRLFYKIYLRPDHPKIFIYLNPDKKSIWDQTPLESPEVKSIWDQVLLKSTDMNSICDQIPLKYTAIKSR